MRLGRSLPLLGWALAGVLALSLAGTALASNLASGGGTETTDAKAAAAPVAQDAKEATARDVARDIARERRHWRLGRLRAPRPRVAHGEVTVRDGTKADGSPRFTRVTFARGTVAGVSGDTLRVASPDGVVTEFTLTGKTKLRRRGDEVTREALRPGTAVFALGRADSGTPTAVRVVLLRKG